MIAQKPPAQKANKGERRGPEGPAAPRRTAEDDAARGCTYSRTIMFRSAQIFLSCSGHTVTVTSPRCAVRRKYM